MVDRKSGVAIVGCGNIADRYAKDLFSYPQVELIGVTDLVAQKAKDMATKYDCRAYPTLKALVDDPSVELVVNLTTHHAHREVVAQCLETEWGRAVLDMAEALIQDRPHRATGEQAAHVVEILCAVTESMPQNRPVLVHSDFTPPVPMDWALKIRRNGEICCIAATS